MRILASGCGSSVHKLLSDHPSELLDVCARRARPPREPVPGGGEALHGLLHRAEPSPRLPRPAPPGLLPLAAKPSSPWLTPVTPSGRRVWTGTRCRSTPSPTPSPPCPSPPRSPPSAWPARRRRATAPAPGQPRAGGEGAPGEGGRGGARRTWNVFMAATSCGGSFCPVIHWNMSGFSCAGTAAAVSAPGVVGRPRGASSAALAAPAPCQRALPGEVWTRPHLVEEAGNLVQLGHGHVGQVGLGPLPHQDVELQEPPLLAAVEQLPHPPPLRRRRRRLPVVPPPGPRQSPEPEGGRFRQGGAPEPPAPPPHRTLEQRPREGRGH